MPIEILWATPLREALLQRRCSRCGLPGHNVTTCVPFGVEVDALSDGHDPSIENPIPVDEVACETVEAIEDL